MIEPQNNLLPLSSSPAPANAQHGDMTFGEMLAQTLGLVPQSMGDLFAGRNGDAGGGEQTAGDSEGNADTAPARRVGVEGMVAASGAPSPFVLARPGTGDSVDQADPVNGDGTAPVAVKPGLPERPTDDGGDSAILAVVVPAVVAADAAPVSNDTEQTGAGVQPADTLDSASAAPEVGQTMVPVVAEPATPEKGGPVQPVPTPAESVAPVVSDPDLLAGPPVEGGAAGTEPVRDDVETGFVPISPNHVSKPRLPDHGDAGEQPVAVNHDSVHMAAASSVPPPAVGLAGERTVALQSAGVAVTEGTPVQVRDTRVRLEPATTHTGATMPSLSPETTSGPIPTVSNFGEQAIPIQHTALAERVLRAVEMQSTQPPPRTMIVDIPEIDGLRLVVSVRSGAEVHVVPASSSAQVGGLQPFLSELEGVLADRGFVMTGDGRRRGGNQQYEKVPDLPRRSRPSYARPADNDLRI